MATYGTNMYKLLGSLSCTQGITALPGPFCTDQFHRSIPTRSQCRKTSCWLSSKASSRRFICWIDTDSRLACRSTEAYLCSRQQTFGPALFCCFQGLLRSQASPISQHFPVLNVHQWNVVPGINLARRLPSDFEARCTVVPPPCPGSDKSMPFLSWKTGARL